MKVKKPVFVVLAVVFSMIAVLTFVGCSNNVQKNDNGVNNQNKVSDGGNDQGAANTELTQLLPSKEGFTWIYNGFAEYGHRMTLESIEKANDSFKYNIQGVVDDPSGGEAWDRDFSLEITYFIENGNLIQVKRESAMLDSDFDFLELIRFPLEEGNTWEQNVQRKDGSEAVLECTIEEVNEGNDAEGNEGTGNTGTEGEGVALYTVMYREKGSDYYEKRVFKEGVGIVSFEKLLILQDQSFPAGYSLYEEVSGYPKE